MTILSIYFVFTVFSFFSQRHLYGCGSVSPQLFSFLIGPLEFAKASLHRWVIFGNGGFISPPLFPFPLFPLFADKGDGFYSAIANGIPYCQHPYQEYVTWRRHPNFRRPVNSDLQCETSSRSSSSSTLDSVFTRKFAQREFRVNDVLRLPFTKDLSFVKMNSRKSSII